MTHSPFLPLSVLAMALFGEALDLPILKACSEITALGLVVFLVWYGVTRALPKIQNTFREEAQNQRAHHALIQQQQSEEARLDRQYHQAMVGAIQKEHQATIERLTETMAADSQRTEAVLRRVVEHCAEVRGQEAAE